ncbi:MAG: hypothetical protein K9L74_02180 [Candidatus Izimaplasma sp.]|nr:hypothetical protein [Candidatus Izimaplasma bacterium]
MKRKINLLLDWFETKFNFLIELMALIGGVFCILLAIFLFLMLLINKTWLQESFIEVIFLPGIIGVFGILILFALRITRYLTHRK